MYRFLFFILLILSSCYSGKEEKQGTKKIDWEKAEKIKNSYAQGFSIEKSESYYRLTIIDPQSKKLFGKYVLYNEKNEKPVLAEGEIGISYPIKSMASVSTTHLPFLKLLGSSDVLTGFAGHKFVLDPVFIELFKKNKVLELGSDNSLNHEKLIELYPDIFMVYPFGSLEFKKIEEAGISVFYNTEYLEIHPLGKTEWIKVFGLLLGEEKYKEASEKFISIEKKYNGAKSIFGYFTHEPPTAFTGLSFSGTWYVPGGKSFQSVFLYDAGFSYMWHFNKDNNSLTLPEEVVIDMCLETDYWIIVSSEKKGFSLADLLEQNPRYKHFEAVKNGNVIFCNSNEVDYFGDGIIEPDVILDDLISFMMGTPAEKYQPKYFHQLK